MVTDPRVRADKQEHDMRNVKHPGTQSRGNGKGQSDPQPQQQQQQLRQRHPEAAGAPGPTGALQPGTEAPDFNLLATPDQRVDLNHFRGRPVVLVFYPADWSPVCGDQLSLYNEILPEFNRHAAQVIGLSVDGVWCHTAYAQDRKLHFPLLADFHPKGAVAQQYGVYRDQDGVAERALFVIDEDGIIRWSYVSPLGVNPGADGILNALEQLDAEKSRANAGLSKEYAHA
jgi:peroxiredoxin